MDSKMRMVSAVLRAWTSATLLIVHVTYIDGASASTGATCGFEASLCNCGHGEIRSCFCSMSLKDVLAGAPTTPELLARTSSGAILGWGLSQTNSSCCTQQHALLYVLEVQYPSASTGAWGAWNRQYFCPAVKDLYELKVVQGDHAAVRVRLRILRRTGCNAGKAAKCSSPLSGILKLRILPRSHQWQLRQIVTLTSVALGCLLVTTILLLLIYKYGRVQDLDRLRLKSKLKGTPLPQTLSGSLASSNIRLETVDGNGPWLSPPTTSSTTTSLSQQPTECPTLRRPDLTESLADVRALSSSLQLAPDQLTSEENIQCVNSNRPGSESGTIGRKQMSELSLILPQFGDHSQSPPVRGAYGQVHGRRFLSYDNVRDVELGSTSDIAADAEVFNSLRRAHPTGRLLDLGMRAGPEIGFRAPPPRRDRPVHAAQRTRLTGSSSYLYNPAFEPFNPFSAEGPATGSSRDSRKKMVCLQKRRLSDYMNSRRNRDSMGSEPRNLNPGGLF